ncbi:MAG: beta-lactamase family protein [Gammaproteobacteria bacterium]|nr:beta-lactamase family protein [Gammaproteobacteria bacterium]
MVTSDFKNALSISLFLLQGNAAYAQKIVSLNNQKVVSAQIEKHLQPENPGIQYIVVNAQSMVYEYSGGLADIKHHVPVDRNTTMAAFSMTKPLTAIAILQLVEADKIRLDDRASSYVYHPYDPSITIKQLLNHTSGISNPLPLRWVHTPEKHVSFDENAALKKILAKNPNQKFRPGEKYLYSNIAYWLLGKIIEKVAKQIYPEYVNQYILTPLMIKPEELSFTIVRPENHAHGYLKKYSLMNLVKGFLLNNDVLGEYEGDWLCINDVYLDGPSFGGAIGSASAFSRILQDLLGEHSVLISDTTRDLLFQQTQNNSNKNIEMTLGWHIGDLAGIRYFFKEGGGAGFHSEMRIYPAKGVATVVMVNQTTFDTKKFLSDLDAMFLI